MYAPPYTLAYVTSLNSYTHISHIPYHTHTSSPAILISLHLYQDPTPPFLAVQHHWPSFRKTSTSGWKRFGTEHSVSGPERAEPWVTVHVPFCN